MGRSKMTGEYNFKITLVHVISNAIKEYKTREEFMKKYLTRNSPLPKGYSTVLADKEMGLILGFCTFLSVFWSNHLTFQSLGFLIHRTMSQNQCITCRVRVLILDQKTSKKTLVPKALHVVLEELVYFQSYPCSTPLRPSWQKQFWTQTKWWEKGMTLTFFQEMSGGHILVAFNRGNLSILNRLTKAYLERNWEKEEQGSLTDGTCIMGSGAQVKGQRKRT